LFKCGPPVRQLEKYKYWGERLAVIKEAYDEAHPETLMQWLHDRRSAEWWGVWTAIFLTIFFGLVQSIEGAIQVFKAYRPS